MKKIVVLLGVLVVGLFANESVSHHTDIIPRTINFLIFIGILWYLLADKVKSFYKSREESIANSFQEIEEQLVKSEEQKEALKAEVELAHKKAEDIIKTAKIEAEMLKSQIIENAKKEIEVLNKQFEEQKAYEEIKMKRRVVEEHLNYLVKDIHLSSEEVADIVTKKVG